VNRAVFLATAALLAMLILVPMAMGQETTMLGAPPCLRGVGVMASPLPTLVVLPSFCLRPCCCSGPAS
jgi:hypothetical protein